jgi:hypothetical protein
MSITPYEYYDGKLGVKLSFLIFDRQASQHSLNLISYNALNKRVLSKNCSERQLRRASLNYDALIEYSTLCREWKDSLTIAFGSPKTEVKKSWFAQHYEADRKAFDFFCAYKYGDDNRKLDLKLIEEYTYNASILNTVIKLKDNRKNYMRALGVNNINIWESLSADVNAFREVAHTLPTTSRGLRNKLNEYTAGGYAAIISGKLTNQNAAKVKEDKQFSLIDELCAKHTNLDNTLICTLYNTVAEKMGWPEITAQTIANRKKESNLVVFAGRNGASALSNKVLMQNKRSKPSASMLFWSVDGWDAELLYQKTDINPKGYQVTTYHNRLTMVVVMDPFNNYPVGYAIGTHETPGLIKAALRNAYQHAYELFGDYYRPYQLQTDNYAIKTLKPLYEACSQHFTPAKVKNAKAKPVEPYFRRLNEDYCKLFDNWSGHNVNSGSNNQPNAEYLNKIRHTFPDEHGARMQLISVIETERSKKQAEFKEAFNNVSIQHKSALQLPMYLRFLGETSLYTNRLQHDGFRVTINGQTEWFDSFDINFRRNAHQDWAVMYDPENLNQILVTNATSRNGKLVEIVGTYEFLLDKKHLQPMALAERQEGDALMLEQVKSFNKSVTNYITEERKNNATQLEELFQAPQLNDTLAKHLLTDSLGQHKNNKSANRLQENKQKLIEVPLAVETRNYTTEISQYNSSKVNLNDYLD